MFGRFDLDEKTDDLITLVVAEGNDHTDWDLDIPARRRRSP
jgi:hypothetical protein